MDEANRSRYELAITLIQYYVQLMWFIFGAFLLAETVLLAAFAALAKDGPWFLMFIVACVGCLLAVPWYTSFRYNHGLYLLRVHEARAMEPNVATFFTTGESLIKGSALTTSWGKTVRLSWFVRTLSPSASVLWLVALFFCTFAVLAVVTMLGGLPSRS